ncbi:MAG: L,D-transpeptidase [Clostridia bacterium]|nr:L,D-transpeptidase [Clostridia bacterium]
MNKYVRSLAAILCALLCIVASPRTAAAKTVEEWLEGYDTGAIWFGEDFAYDITDEEACWELLMRPITVLDAGQTEAIAPRKTPGGEKVNTDKLGGTINGESAAVHVLGEDEDGWTLIEGLDYYNRIIRGYVKTNLLKTVTPSKEMGIIIDKLTQQMYVFVDGKYFSSCAVSTGLANDEQPYNETAAGEYLMVSRVGDFDSEGMICARAIRFNGGDMIHEVPYTVLADGTKRYSKWEALLGSRASHGCIRTARIANPDGLNEKWIWDHYKYGTKVVIWDDYGRAMPYPDDSLKQYYNPNGGSFYHGVENCRSVKERYLPLTAFTYGELETDPFKKLEPCSACAPAKRKAVIDEENAARGTETPNKPAETPVPAVTETPETVETGDGVTITFIDP